MARVTLARVLKRLEGQLAGVEGCLLGRRHRRQGSQMPEDLKEGCKGRKLLVSAAQRGATAAVSGAPGCAATISESS